MRRLFDEEMQELELALIKLCAYAADSVLNLKEQLGADGDSCFNKARDLFHESESMAASIEGKCVRLLILRQPVARDLRKIKSAMSVVYDLVRIAEMTHHTVRMRIRSRDDMPKIGDMMLRAEEMVVQATDSYLKHDTVSAQTVIDGDDEVDEMFLAVRKDLVKLLKKSNDTDDWVLDSLLLAKYLERIADHAVNIAKNTMELFG